jgi:hypothetical protein
MAWVANRSTRVRKAVEPITIERRSTPEECLSLGIADDANADAE